MRKKFIDEAIFRLNENTPKIERCLSELSQDEVWKKPNESLNSVGNLILHLCGNITQYIQSSIGGQQDHRERKMEFSATKTHNKVELFKLLTHTLDEAIDVMRKLSGAELEQKKRIQGFDSTALGNIIQVVEHYSYHTGQIVFWTKLLKDKDMDFYAGIDLNIKNDPA